MDTKPSPLFLVVLAGLGTALLSPLNANGTPIFVLVIPFAIVATALYHTEIGIVVGAGSSILSGVLVHSLEFWNMVSYALAAAVIILAYDAIFTKKKNEISALLFAVLGTLVYEFINELSTRQTTLFRPEIFLGTNPVLGLQIVANVFATGILLSFYHSEKSTAKK